MKYLICKDNFNTLLHFTKGKKYKVKQNKIAKQLFCITDDRNQEYEFDWDIKEGKSWSFENWFYNKKEMLQMNLDILIKD